MTVGAYASVVAAARASGVVADCFESKMSEGGAVAPGARDGMRKAPRRTRKKGKPGCWT